MGEIGSAASEIARPPLNKPARILLGSWFALGVLPVFPSMIGFRFVPTAEWILKTYYLGVGAGLISAALLLWLALKGIHTVSASTFKKAVSVLAAPFLGYFFGKNVVVIAGPMILALIAGYQIELPFNVAHADLHRSKGCRSPIELQGLPSFFDRVCGAPNDFRRLLKPGDRILVIGRGTRLGVFPETLAISTEERSDLNGEVR